LEKEVEKLKLELAHRTDFTCLAGFTLFDYINRVTLTKA